MGRQAKYSDGEILWRSKNFPELIFTSVMLEAFKKAYPFVPKFLPELEKAEAWLLTHPERQPARNWAAFINNWMRNANTYNQKKPAAMTDPETHAEQRRSQYGASFTRSNGGAPMSFKEIIERVAPMLKADKQKGEEESGSQPTVSMTTESGATTATSKPATENI